MDLGLIYCLPFLIILNLEKLKIKYLFFLVVIIKYNLKILSILRKIIFTIFNFVLTKVINPKKY